MEPGSKPVVLGSLGSEADLKGAINAQGWNQYHVIARGNVLVQVLNGHVMSLSLIHISKEPQRKKVTFAWNAEDVAKVQRSMFGPIEQRYKYIDLPLSNYCLLYTSRCV